MQDRPPGNLRIFRAALMITGTTVGIGILGLPIKTGLAGLIPSFLATLAVWAVMLGTGLVLARAIVASGDPKIDIASLVHRRLGAWGRAMTVAGYLVLVYGVIVAHLAGGGEVLSALTGGSMTTNQAMGTFFVVSTGIALLGVAWVEKINFLLMTILFLSFGAIVFEAAGAMEASRFAHRDWNFLAATVPIIVCSQAYQLIVPSVCRMLDNDRRAVRKALVAGTAIPVALNSVWMLAVVGALPLAGSGSATVLSAFQNGLPATVPLASVLQSAAFGHFVLVFSLVVLVSSYVLQSTAILGFFDDLLPARLEGRRRAVSALLAFLPPLAVVVIYPGIFLKALDVIGGGSVILLFVVIPGMMLYRDPASRGIAIRVIAAGLLVVGLLFMGLEAAQEAGLLQIHPNVEYWS